MHTVENAIEAPVEGDTIWIHGGIRDAEVHLAAYGIAAIIGGSRIVYEARDVGVILPCSESEAFDVISERLVDMTSPNGWSYGEKGESVISPYATCGEDQSVDLYRRRDELLDDVERGDQLTSTVIGGIGKPNYWKLYDSKRKPNMGASQAFQGSAPGGSSCDMLKLTFAAPSSVKKPKNVSTLLTPDAVRNMIVGGDGPYVPEAAYWSIGTSPWARVLLAMIGSGWALNTSPGVTVPARTAGCIYDREGGVASRNVSALVLPIFSVPVSVARVRACVSNGAWLPSRVKVECKVLSCTLSRTPSQEKVECSMASCDFSRLSPKEKVEYKVSPRSRSWAVEQGVKYRMVFPVTVVPTGPQDSSGKYGAGEELR
ncbi:MAG: hypothetical protein E6R04_06140 [Spirochaetes bacterium]|nr:MAG: hypothetical protein E6R04_06140 [Spirochaetota bacterium]